MQTYHVRLESPVFTSYRCQRAADSLDIDITKKSVHELKINANINNDFSVGLILGASGSGKTTLAKHIYGQNCFEINLDNNKSILDQLPKEWSYDECASALQGIGLTSVPQWLKPISALSNGQKARTEAVFLMTKSNETIVIDEWTSVVDRTVAKIMSHCIQKFAKRNNKKIVLLSCHYDVVEWLDPDWIIDCNKAEFIDRRLLRPEERQRKEKLIFTIKPCQRSVWPMFSKYHYLSENMPGGKVETYGLFHNENQIGFQCFANYVPHRDKTKPIQMHFNRTVIHPDYAGLGLGIKLITLSSFDMMKRYENNLDIRGKFSSQPVYKAMIKDKNWKLVEQCRQIGKKQAGDNMDRKSGFRENIKTYSFKFLGKHQ